LRALEAIRASAPDASVKATEWQRFLTDTTTSMKMLNAGKKEAKKRKKKKMGEQGEGDILNFNFNFNFK
jgi:hypothetical protein